MTPVIHAFPGSGSAKWRGVDIDWHYRHATDEVEFRIRMPGQQCAYYRACANDDAEIVRHWADYEIQRMTMVSPRYMASNQLGGLVNGLSGQAAQAVPSNSHQSQPGGSSTASQIQQQLAAKQAAIAATAQQQLHVRQMQALYNQAAGGTHPRLGADAEYKPLKTEGFKCGEIIAFRGWRVTPEGFLRSMSADVIWGPGEPMEGKTESKKEHNGVYAYKAVRDFLRERGRDLDVYGKVALWGDIIEHELGYRAQFAKIISLEHFLKRDKPHGISLDELRGKYCPPIAEAA